MIPEKRECLKNSNFCLVAFKWFARGCLDFGKLIKCGANNKQEKIEMAQSLYDKYGGFPTISALVHKFYDKLLNSPTLENYFRGANMERLMDHQTKFLCMVLGGPNNYTGRELGAAHGHLNITPGAFGEVAQHLKTTLEEGGVSAEDVGTILGVVASTQSAIVKQAHP